MLFHKFLDQNSTEWYCSASSWFEARSKLYADVALWDKQKPDTVYFEFSEPNAGWIDVSIYSNGIKLLTFPASTVLDPFCDLKKWLEDIVEDTKLSSEMYIDCEGRIIILHYEHICLAEVGVRRMFINEDRDKDKWEHFDANSHPGTGLFYVFDSSSDSIPVACYCITKQLLLAVYGALLYYASRTDSARLLGPQWYYDYKDDEGKLTMDNWSFYNEVKSSIIERGIYSNYSLRLKSIKTNKQTPIKETVHMWAEWGGGLFWHQRGGCCGNADGFFVDTDKTKIDLKSLTGLKEWYDEFDTGHPEYEWPDEEYYPWLERGWKYALEIRKMLPPSVDLFYQWQAIPRPSDTLELPYIVPDLRNYKERKNWIESYGLNFTKKL